MRATPRTPRPASGSSGSSSSLPFVDPPAGVAPQADRPRQHARRRFAGKLCTVCGVVTSRAGSRCSEHAWQSNRGRHNALYSTRAWQRLSARVLRVWRGEHGNWCPGYQRPDHAAADLTVDHVVPLAAGGAPFDIAKHRRALSIVQLDEGCVDRPGWGSPCGDALARRPRLPTVCSRPGFAGFGAPGISVCHRSRRVRPTSQALTIRQFVGRR